MSTVFIPTSDYSNSAASAETITSLDVGFIPAGQSVAVSFKVGNRGETTILIAISSDNPAVSLTVETLTLGADSISDTITATISAPLDCQSVPEVATISAGGGELLLTWQSVGANVDRLPQTPDRTGDFTDNITSVLDRVGEALRVYQFDPVAYDETDTRIYATPEGRFRSQRDVCCRLDPLDDRWGYARSVETVKGSFQAEEWSITDSFTRDNSTVSYSGSATLYLAAEFELTRSWALFNPARGADREQYKRTVFLTQRQGQTWALQTIIPVYRGEQLAYWHVNLLPLSSSTMGSPAHFNPFALTYEYESDRPYACYACRTDIRFAEQLTGGSEAPEVVEPVALSLGSCSAYMLKGGKENVRVVSLCTEHVDCSTDYHAITISDETTWGVNQAVIKSVFVETTYEGEWILSFLPSAHSVTCYDDLFTALGDCETSANIMRAGSQTAWLDLPYKDEDGTRSVHLWFSGILRNEAGAIIGFPEVVASKVYIHAIA